ncbi:hypothetical protein ACKWMY_28110 [Serratia sp. J2]|uniref:hypothetical protein n=1 Tax=Serratia sp. J2 TaxID=3386551 RepID=UPI0039172D32
MSNQQPCKDMNRLHAAITDIDCLSQQAFSEIAAAADLLLHWMESPEGYQRPDVIAAALSSISHKAQQTLENIGLEAESVGCEYVDLDSKRRFAALEAFKAGVNHA